MFLPNAPTTTSKNPNFWALFWVLVFLHQLYFGWFLVRSDFVPYVMDGNETFSVWWHAHNLYTFDFWKSFGLTDESYGLTEASHPFFHTHQGNMPRLFGFLIYALGARTVEAQVLITTLVIGNLTLFFCYASIAKITRPAIAFIFCLFLFSDYLLYAQWHVVTYRVWYGFLFFGTLFAISNAKDRIWPYALLGLLFFLLFYFELVFAVYVSIATALWAIWLHWGSVKKIATIYAVQLVGGLAALALLFTQLVLVFGFDVVKVDFSTTFLARNASAANTYGSVEAFFRSHNIVFWNNFRDGDSLRTLVALVRSLGFYIFQVWTPVFFVLIAVPLFGVVISFVEGRDRCNAAANLAIVRDWKTRAAIAPLVGCVVVALLALMAVLLPGALFGILPPRRPEIIGALALLIVIAASLSLLVFASWAARPQWVQVCRGILAVALGGLLILKSHILYDQTYRDIWVPLYQDWTIRLLLRAATIFAFLAAGGIAVMGASASFGTTKLPIGRALMFLGIGFVTYGLIYLLSPGYVVSGYAERHAPFAIVFVAMVPTIAIYSMTAAARRHGVGILAPGNFRLVQQRIIVPLFLAIVVAVPALLWTNVQVYYAHLFPPDHLAFLQRLKSAPLHGATFAVNNYAAPVAYYAGNWAYFDAVIGNDAGLSDQSSRWFSDWKSNPRYASPDYYVCMKARTFAAVLFERFPTRLELPFRFCKDERILREEEFSDELIASDFAQPKFWSVIAFYGGRPSVDTVSTSVSFNEGHWMVASALSVEPNLARQPLSTEFEILALKDAMACNVKKSDLKVVQASRDGSSLSLPHGFKGIFLVRARVGTEIGMGKWKSGDLWTVKGGSTADVPVRCPPRTAWDSSGLADLTIHQKGWGSPESWGTWTIASEATLRPLPVSDIPENCDLLLEATVRGFVPKPGGVQHVTVRANGTAVADWALTDTRPAQEVAAHIPRTLVNGRSNLVLSFDIANPTSPASIALTSDARQLGMGLVALKLKRLDHQ